MLSTGLDNLEKQEQTAPEMAQAALREDETLAQLCQEFELHAIQITEWKG